MPLLNQMLIANLWPATPMTEALHLYFLPSMLFANLGHVSF